MLVSNPIYVYPAFCATPLFTFTLQIKFIVPTLAIIYVVPFELAVILPLLSTSAIDLSLVEYTTFSAFAFSMQNVTLSPAFNDTTSIF